MLNIRYQWAGRKLDLDLAIQKLELAISVAPADSLDQANFRVHISRLLFSLYEAKGNELDLDRAIMEGEEAVGVIDREDPGSAYHARGSLAELLSKRFLIQPERLRDLENAMKEALIASDKMATTVVFSFARNLCSQSALGRLGSGRDRH